MNGPRRLRQWAILLAVALPVATIPGSVEAQDESLDQVERFMLDGRFESAREVLQGWLETQRSTAEWVDRQRGTWLRALLTVDPEMADLDLRRLAVEYPGGPFSDRALLRLAQSAVMRSDTPAALRHLRQLLRDYPASPLREEARLLTVRIEESTSASSN